MTTLFLVFLLLVCLIPPVAAMTQEGSALDALAVVWLVAVFAASVAGMVLALVEAYR